MLPIQFSNHPHSFFKLPLYPISKKYSTIPTLIQQKWYSVFSLASKHIFFFCAPFLFPINIPVHLCAQTVFFIHIFYVTHIFYFSLGVKIILGGKLLRQILRGGWSEKSSQKRKKTPHNFFFMIIYEYDFLLQKNFCMYNL